MEEIPMKLNNTRSNSYSVDTAKKHIDLSLPIQCVTSFIEIQHKFIDNKRTDEITGYKLWFIQKGLNPFTIKFEEEPELPDFLSIVEFEQLEGIEIRSNVYFKAKKLKVVK
jgi:hypothetical protein